MVAARAERFAGVADFEACLGGARMTPDGFDANGDLGVDRANDPVAVSVVQQALIDLGYPCPLTGVYDDLTAEVVRQFKNDRDLALPPGLAAHDGVTGRGTSRALDDLFADAPGPAPEDPQVRYTDRKSHYTGVALGKANAGAHVWQPELGFALNRPQIVDVYEYYRDVYLARPDTFLWAGLGRMAGGAVVGGLDLNPLDVINSVVMVRIGRDIFYDLAWLHEAYLDQPDAVVELAGLHDRFNSYARYDAAGNVGYVPAPPSTSYAAAWRKIVSGDPQSVADGNRDLLQNEQWSIIQPHYDHLKTLPFAGLPSGVTGAIHPYQRDFVEEVQGGDVLGAEDRWRWITGNMWQNWVLAGAAERSRLVSLPFASLCRREFGEPGRPDLLPPGGP